MKMLADLAREETHWIAQGQYWLANDARVARLVLEGSSGTVQDANDGRTPGHLLVAHSARLAKLNGTEHMIVPWAARATAR